MRSTIAIYLCLLFLAYQLDVQTVQGYTLMTHLAQQANSLQYGLNLANRYNHRYGGSKTRVAFSARANSNQKLSSGNMITFAYHNTNQGSALRGGRYFSAPHSGLYVFTWSIRTYSSKVAYTSIRVNGSIKQKSLCYSGTSSYYDTCSNTVVLYVNKGSTVGIYCDASYAYIASPYSSFSGWEL
ncbi:uncharacterized protein LOC125655173 [Ostrea edulis]|uniref:uncharacterized protein LOC125655173 n=1 Tax=Ostrea edulis TaxID=37623 RepID=UPI0020940814|nr:uncharacterized protein LOC125655173 [Ostrea edulis]XP_048741306.1 uncharacterized protein LOC125655173 [Ostrea edulis]